MGLLTKVDYYGLSATGWVPESTEDNKETLVAQAQGPDGFLVAVDAYASRIKPTVNYIATPTATAISVKLGDVKTVGSDKVAIGSVTFTTAAGQAPKLTVSGSQVESGATSSGCTHTISQSLTTTLFHAQDLGLFSIDGGQLQNSTFTWNGDIGIADVDGTIKSSELVGGSLTVTGTVIGVNGNGTISTPMISPNAYDGKTGVLTNFQETNPNGDYPSYNFTITWPISAD